MPDFDQLKEQAKSAEGSVQDKTEGATKGLKDKLDYDGDGKTDASDIKAMAKDATDKVKGIFHKS
jgi:hypothetical protein